MLVYIPYMDPMGMIVEVILFNCLGQFPCFGSSRKSKKNLVARHLIHSGHVVPALGACQAGNSMKLYFEAWNMFHYIEEFSSPRLTRCHTNLLPNSPKFGAGKMRLEMLLAFEAVLLLHLVCSISSDVVQVPSTINLNSYLGEGRCISFEVWHRGNWWSVEWENFWDWAVPGDVAARVGHLCVGRHWWTMTIQAPNSPAGSNNLKSERLLSLKLGKDFLYILLDRIQHMGMDGYLLLLLYTIFVWDEHPFAAIYRTCHNAYWCNLLVLFLCMHIVMFMIVYPSIELIERLVFEALKYPRIHQCLLVKSIVSTKWKPTHWNKELTSGHCAGAVVGAIKDMQMDICIHMCMQKSTHTHMI